jgi:hypothetical protein
MTLLEEVREARRKGLRSRGYQHPRPEPVANGRLGRLRSKRFLGSPTRTLHAHHRRASTEYFQGRIRVGVIAVSAGDALKDRLALAALSVHDTAGLTGLRGETRIDGDQDAAAFLQLVGEHPLEHAPALRENGSVEASLLPDATARLLDGATSARCHSVDPKGFDRHEREPASEVRGRPMQKVTAKAARFSAECSYALALVGIATGTAVPARKHPLSAPTLALKANERSGCAHGLAAGHGDRVCDAPVEPHGAGADARLSGDLNDERDCPPPSVTGYGSLSNIWQVAGDTKAHPPHLRQPDLGPFVVQPAHHNRASLKPEGVVHPPLAGRWILGAALKERSKCVVEIAQGLLFADRGRGLYPVELRAERGQLSTLRCERDVSARRAMMLSPEIAALLPSEVVDQPTNTGDLLKEHRLRCRGSQAKLVAAKKHATESSPLPPPPQDKGGGA